MTVPDLDPCRQVDPPAETAPHVHRSMERLEGNEALDATASALARLLPDWITTGPGRALLSGEWLGHSLHPLMTDFPLGCWSSASLLDLLGPRRYADASRKLVGLGLLASLPTAAAGFSDWSRLGTRDRRVGVAHAQLNGVAVLLYGASYLARRRDLRRRGVLLGLLGGLAATASGYLGGHLTTTRSVTRDNQLLDAAATGH